MKKERGRERAEARGLNEPGKTDNRQPANEFKYYSATVIKYRAGVTFNFSLIYARVAV